jgi:trimeric autotransporter adhesin
MGVSQLESPHDHRALPKKSKTKSGISPVEMSVKNLMVVLILVLIGALVGCSGNGQSAGNSGSGTPPGGGTPTPTSTPTLTSMVVAPGAATITPGGNQQFTVTGNYSDGSRKDLTSSVQWSSSDPTVASVVSGMATGVANGAVIITAQSGTLKVAANLTVDTPNPGATLQSIAVTPANAFVPVNTNQQFTATGSYSDGSSRDLTARVTWSSSAPGTATLDGAGMATALNAGTTTVSAALSGVQGSTTLTVTAPTISFISVSPVGLTLGIGINQQFTTTATYNNGSSQDLVSGVTWTSSSTSVATVDNNGLVTTVGAGSTAISATVGSFTDSTTLTVVPAHLVSIDVSPNTVSIAQGTSQLFTATGTFDDGSTQLLTSVTWSSSATGTASVDSSGLASGLATGQAIISATAGSVVGSATLTVTGATLVSIAVTPANSSMAVGTSKQFTATGTFSDSTTQDITATALWASSNPAAVTINGQGLASSLATGTTSIIASVGPVNGETGLTVSTAHLVSITISPANPRIAKGTSIKLTATGKFSDGSTSASLSGLTWKSSKPNIAQVRASGLAHGKKGGSVTVSASAAGVTGTTTLTVGTGTLNSIAVTPENPTVTLGNTQQFTATGSFSDGTTQDITLTTHWSSSSASVATVANAPSVSGLATTKATGSSAIGANSGGVTSSTTMTVQ